MKYYSEEKKQLIYFKERNVEKDFWDQHWQNHKEIINNAIQNFSPRSLVPKITTRFLKPEDGPILEGGCGLGDKVLSLKKLNYNVIGIDNAEKTIQLVKKIYPEMPVEIGDVRNLHFTDDYFSGYWSIGVIEHFFEGYSNIMKEMYRVIKPLGYLFLKFPYFSPIRKLKVRIHRYPIINKDYIKFPKVLNKFYQIALNKETVINEFTKQGFKIIYESKEDGIRGFYEENFIFLYFVRKFLDALNNTKNQTILGKIRRIVDKFLSTFSAHTVLLVFQKNN